MVKRLPTMRETGVQFLGWEDLLEKEVAIHSIILAWKIPWTEEPATVHGVAKCRTRLSDFTHSLTHSLSLLYTFAANLNLISNNITLLHG